MTSKYSQASNIFSFFRFGTLYNSKFSGRTNFLLVGDDPGESKIKKAVDKKVEQIDEDKLLELIRTKPGKKSKYEIEAENESSKKSSKTPKKVAKKEKGKNYFKKKIYEKKSFRKSARTDEKFIDGIGDEKGW